MLATADAHSRPEQRVRVRVRGVVQGVGFRPLVYRLAKACRLTGWVRNDGHGVLAEVQGIDVESFLDSLRRHAPPLARVDRLEATRIATRAESGFEIVPTGDGPITTTVTPDAAVCGDCLTELFDPTHRCYRYPFINCTNCGPRYTITRQLPYDRPQTSMAGFPLCRDCAIEYGDPTNRRFHAQPVACPACGPGLEMRIEEILDRLRHGEVVAIKGLGGFHLACDARNEAAVTRLRRRKQRGGKAFAVMVANVSSARALAEVSAAEAALMTEPARPIVLVRRHGDVVAPSVAPGLGTLGIMLPSTPIHYLLFHEAAGRPEGIGWLDSAQDLVLVMTSANPRGEPLLIDDAAAKRRLAEIADVTVGHNRSIVARCDDSVMRILQGKPSFVRRARGYVPRSIKLARPVPCILGVGGHLKSTVCVTRGDEAFLSQHVGDMDNGETLRFFAETVEHLLSILAVAPERVAHDLHPDFHATRFASALGVPATAVQHHHAHVAAVMAEYGMTGPVLGLSLDGFGLGLEQQAWGGELLRVAGPTFVRLGHLAPLRQPGGDMAARQPWRMGAAVLHRLGRGHEIETYFDDQPAAGMLAQILERGAGVPETTSCGRLFDAACGLLQVCPTVSYEGQAPMTLEALVTRPAVMRGGWRLRDGVLDLLPVLERLIACEPVEGANLFHGTLIAALTEWVAEAAAAEGVRIVALSGGCFLNRVLAEGLAEALGECSISPLLPRRAPASDVGISLGQVWVAAHADDEGGGACV
jgi:hydrogenase maturation protein HypF